MSEQEIQNILQQNTLIRNENTALRSKVAVLEEELAPVQEQLAWLKKQMFGRKTEQTSVRRYMMNWCIHLQKCMYTGISLRNTNVRIAVKNLKMI